MFKGGISFSFNVLEDKCTHALHFFKKINLFIYFGGIGSLLLHAGFL